MKIKSFQIYIGVIVIAIILLVVFYSQGDNKEIAKIDPETSQMPNDDVHKGMGDNSPSSGNVSSKFKKKMDDLDKYVSENPNDTAKVKEYAELLSASHKPIEAIKLFESILEKNQNRIDILLPLVYLEYTNKNLEKAEKYTYQILKLDPKHEQSQYNLGAIEASKGNNAKAKEIWENVINNYPNSETAQIAEQSLKQLEEAR